jgi:5-hydroxyisourate hydrolase-like protein (transthyretin family)
MKSTPLLFCALAVILLFAGAVAQAQLTGTVTNKTTGRPAAGDTVALVDTQAGMSEAARTTTDARGHYSLPKSGGGNFLVRVTHQGATYFTGAPQGSTAGDITVYDVAAKVDGVLIDEDVLGVVESANGKLHLIERYSMHNSSLPPRTQWSSRTFQIVLPAEAVIVEASAQRPGGLPTSLKLEPDGPKGHYAFNFPIQPDDGDKGTLFQVEYELPYESAKFTFHPQVTLPARTVWVMLPKSMSFAPGAGSAFLSSQQDPGFQTFVAQNIAPGKPLEFTVSGAGSIPREESSAQSGQQPASGAGVQDNGPSQQSGASAAQPGGGIGSPINTPDPLTKFKWWILSGLALLLAASAAFLARKPASATAAPKASPAARSATLLDSLKEELFALESEKIAGMLTPAEYEEQKAALEAVLKRALKRRS